MREKIRELLSTEKGKTLFKFILYMIFFTVVLVICVVGANMGNPYVKKGEESSFSSGEAQSSTSEIKELTYFEKQTLLYEGEYEFEIVVTGEVNISYIGEADNGNVNGFKETEDELIRYSIEDDIVYKLTLTTKEEYDELYYGLDESLFDFKLLFSKLNSTSSAIDNRAEEKIYDYENIDGYNVKVVTDDEGITSMVIKNETIEYAFSFEY